MTNDLLLKIDTLIEMSKSTSNYDTLKAELSDISNEIDIKKREIEDLKASMQDEKYIKASDRIIDENIKVSLELKIQKMELKLKASEKELKKILKEENNAHNLVQEGFNKVTRLTQLLNVLKEKQSGLKKSDTESKEYYQNLIKETEKKLKTSKTNTTELEEEYKKISRKLSDFTKDTNDLKKQITDEKEKRNRTIENLASNESYIDKDRKADDEKRLQYLKGKLEDFQNRKEEILKDPVYIGNIAKESFIEDDRTSCLQEVKKLINFIKTLPFMDIPNSSDVEKILKEAEETTLLERDEFASTIENKKYDGNNLKVLEERQKYLEEQKQEYLNNLEKTKNQIKKIDTVTIKEINALLSSANVVEENLKKDLIEYDKVLNMEKENSTPKKKATLIAAYKKKEEEIATIEEMINAYEIEMEDLMIESKRLEEQEVDLWQRKIDKIDDSLKEIAKKAMISSKATDVLALENDKARLKELNDRITAIRERRKYNETPSEIFDEIEMTLGSIIEEPEETNILEQEKRESDFRITEDLTEEEINLTRTKKNRDVLNQEVKEMKEALNETIEINIGEPKEEQEFDAIIPTEPIDLSILDEVKIDEPVVENPVVENINVLEPSVLEDISTTEQRIPEEKATFSIPLENTPPLKNSPVTERLKVIHIEDLETQEPEVKKEDIMISDFKDDDYIDFDSIIGG